MADTIDSIVNQVYQEMLLGRAAVVEEQEQAPKGLMSSRDGVTTQADAEEAEATPSGVLSIRNFISDLASYYSGDEAESVEIMPTTATMDRSTLYEKYNTPVYALEALNRGNTSGTLRVRGTTDYSYLDELQSLMASAAERQAMYDMESRFTQPIFNSTPDISPRAVRPMSLTPADTADVDRDSIINAAISSLGSPTPPAAATTETAATHNVNFSFIKDQEGYETAMYVPKKGGQVLGKSGATIASGFDLGQRNEADLKGLPEALVTKLKPYLGKKGAAALQYVESNPLSITSAEADTINAFAKKQELDRIIKAFDAASSTDFKDLTEQQQTVVASVAFQYGDLAKKTPNFWKQVTTGDWEGALSNLRNFGDDYSSRRNREADLLAQGM